MCFSSTCKKKEEGKERKSGDKKSHTRWTDASGTTSPSLPEERKMDASENSTTGSTKTQNDDAINSNMSSEKKENEFES